MIKGYNENSDLKDEYPAEHRNNQRLIFLSEILAQNLWSRLLPHLTEEDVRYITPYGYGTKGRNLRSHFSGNTYSGHWIPRGLNSGFIFNKYSKNQYFKGHFDGLYVNSKKHCSIYTVLIYLNDTYEGLQKKKIKRM
jgi:hypothetical protein